MGRRGQIIKRAGQEHRQKFVELLQQATYRHPTWRIWDDFVFMGAAAMSQPFQWVQEREDEYLKRINQYDKATQALFPQMFGEVVLAFEEEGHEDILGEVYMQLNLGNHWKGQFFTPMHICKAMSKMLGTDLSEKIEERGFVTVCDPCCGGGAMLIAHADSCMEVDIDYQRDVMYVGQDIDPVVARMCYISMSLLGMPGYVMIGNTLSYEFHEVMYTPLYFLSGFMWRRQKGVVEKHDFPKSADVTMASVDDEQMQLVI